MGYIDDGCSRCASFDERLAIANAMANMGPAEVIGEISRQLRADWKGFRRNVLFYLNAAQEQLGKAPPRLKVMSDGSAGSQPAKEE